MLHDGEFVDPSGVYLVLVVVLAVTFLAEMHVLQTVSVGVVSRAPSTNSWNLCVVYGGLLNRLLRLNGGRGGSGFIGSCGMRNGFLIFFGRMIASPS